MQINSTTNTAITCSPNSVFEQANQYLSQGFAPTPVIFMGKTPLLENWPQIRLQPEDLKRHFGAEPRNVGIVLGPQSKDLVDIDIDDHIALSLALHFLPKTGMIFGRKSKQKSHWIYRSPGAKTARYKDASGTLIELRGKDNQTVFPPSTHVSGEVITFHSYADPAHVDPETLELACLKISIATILLRHWKPGTRHTLSLAAAGLFAKAGWEQTDVAALIQIVAKQADDEELDDRTRCVASTFENYENGQPIGAAKALSEMIGYETTTKITQWMSKAADSQLPISLPSELVRSADLSTDFQAAQTFAQYYKGKIIYCDTADNWFRKDNQVYRPFSKVQVQGCAGRLAHEVGRELTARLPGGHTQIRAFEACSRINHMIELSRDKLRVDWADIDKAENLIGLADGSVYDLDAGQIVIGHSSIVTKSLGASIDQEAECPNWLTFLRRVFDDNIEVISFIQRAVGYTLTGKTVEQCFFLLIGTGANGKSTFLNVLHNLFGDYAETIPMHSLMVQRHGNEQTNDLALLPGKRFVTATEGEVGQRLAESRIKSMTGGDRISCRRLYHDYFEFVPQFKLWLATNNLPRISGTDEAIWRRIHVVQFPITIPAEERDHDLPYKLRLELPGILNWALQGHQEWAQNGLRPPEQVKMSTCSYKRENDTVAQFIDDCCELDQRAITTVKSLYDQYLRWCEQSGQDALHKITFGKTLAQKQFDKVGRNTGSAWKGLRLKSLSEAAARP